MSQTIREKNKALVLDAFDTLFNKLYYQAAERYWSPNYIQHSAHIEPGREGLFGVAIATGQKTTLSESGIGLPQWAETLAVEFSFYVEAIFPVGIDVRVACWPETSPITFSRCAICWGSVSRHASVIWPTNVSTFREKRRNGPLSAH
jgi:hypothetical protein